MSAPVTIARHAILGNDGQFKSTNTPYIPLFTGFFRFLVNLLVTQTLSFRKGVYDGRAPMTGAEVNR